MKKNTLSFVVTFALITFAFGGSVFAQTKTTLNMNFKRLNVLINIPAEGVKAINADFKGQIPFTEATQEEKESIVSQYNIPRDEPVMVFGASWAPTAGSESLKQYDDMQWFGIIRKEGDHSHNAVINAFNAAEKARVTKSNSKSNEIVGALNAAGQKKSGQPNKGDQPQQKKKDPNKDQVW